MLAEPSAFYVFLLAVITKMKGLPIGLTMSATLMGWEILEDKGETLFLDFF